MSGLPTNAKILEYKIIDQLGVGGFAHTYLAIDTNLDKKVAIKEFFVPRLCRRVQDYRVEALPGAERRFQNYLANFIEEARILARFDQKNIVKVLRYFEALGTAFIIMEFVEGRPMGDYFAFGNVLDEDRINRWLRGILVGLNEVHGTRLIHGDIKPKNIIINEDDEAVLIDFGASVIFKTVMDSGEPLEELALSPDYAAPEQLVPDAKLDHRLDLYAVGAVFYEAITSEKHRRAAKEGVDVKTELFRYKRYYNQKLLASIAKALEDSPDARFVDAEEWLDRVTLSALEKAARFLRRHKARVAGLLLFCCLVLYGGYYVVVNGIDRTNYRYKLFASTSEVLDRLRSGDRYERKIRDAIAYLEDFGNRYRTHADEIEQPNLISGRTDTRSLARIHPEIARTRARLAEIAETIATLRDKYYFDFYDEPLVKADGIIKDFSARQAEFTQRLFLAFVEDRIVERGRREKIKLDGVALSHLLAALEGDRSFVHLDDLVSRGVPVVEDFLARERANNALAAFNAAKHRTIERIRDIADRYRKNKRYGEFAPIIERVKGADRLNQLPAIMEEAVNLSGAIDRERKLEAQRRARMKLESETRAVVNAIDGDMIRIDGGRFEMGSNDHGYSRPPRTVRVRPFYVMKNEVVHAQWAQCVRSKKCREVPNERGADFPVTRVTWDDTQRFIEWINGKSTRFSYRLMSEAEWEYIVRKYGFVVKELTSDLSSVSADQTNRKGVNSIVGNALEWLDDCWHGGFVGAPGDSRSWNYGLQCDRRVVRGSNWKDQYDINKENVAYFRPVGVPRTEHRPSLGFRLAGDRK